MKQRDVLFTFFSLAKLENEEVIFSASGVVKSLYPHSVLTLSPFFYLRILIFLCARWLHIHDFACVLLSKGDENCNARGFLFLFFKMREISEFMFFLCWSFNFGLRFEQGSINLVIWLCEHPSIKPRISKYFFFNTFISHLKRHG